MSLYYVGSMKLLSETDVIALYDTNLCKLHIVKAGEICGKTVIGYRNGYMHDEYYCTVKCNGRILHRVGFRSYQMYTRNNLVFHIELSCGRYSTDVICCGSEIGTHFWGDPFLYLMRDGLWCYDSCGNRVQPLDISDEYALPYLYNRAVKEIALL